MRPRFKRHNSPVPMSVQLRSAVWINITRDTTLEAMMPVLGLVPAFVLSDRISAHVNQLSTGAILVRAGDDPQVAYLHTVTRYLRAWERARGR